MNKITLSKTALTLSLGIAFLFALNPLLRTQEVEAQAPVRKPSAAPSAAAHSSEINRKLLIKAKEVNNLLKQKSSPILLDVRSRLEYDQEHIKGAVSYPYQIISMNKTFNFPKDRMLVCYCGCPHHLSGLSAEILLKHGYKSVRVIDEGFFGWKEQGLPISAAKGGPRRTSLEFNGQLHYADHKPVRYADIFLAHEKTGQLEATRTDAQGHFHMGVHFLGVEMAERLVFSVDRKVIQTTSFKDLQTGQVQLTLPQKLAHAHHE